MDTGFSGVFTVTSKSYIMVTVTFGPVAGVNEDWKPRKHEPHENWESEGWPRNSTKRRKNGGLDQLV